MFSLETKKKILDSTDLFVLDMDGTFYLENDILDGSLDFLDSVKKAGKRYIFFTNNSSTSSEEYIKKLSRMNCHITSDMIMTSGDVMIKFLQTKYKGESVYLLGTEPLRKSFESAGINLYDAKEGISSDGKRSERPDIVVVGFDKTLTYETLTNACTYIRNGATFLATHLDINCPVKDGFIPDCGAICAAIELSTGVKPRFVGKPFKETVEMIVASTGVTAEKIAFVGDRIYTDVATGVNNGAMGVLVLTGETKESDIPESEVQPDVVFASIKEMGELLAE